MDVYGQPAPGMCGHGAASVFLPCPCTGNLTFMLELLGNYTLKRHDLFYIMTFMLQLIGYSK